MIVVLVVIAVVIYGAIRVLMDGAVYPGGAAKVIGMLGFLAVAAGLLLFG